LALTLALAAPLAPANAKTLELTNRMVNLSGAINTKSINKAVKAVLEWDGQSHDPIWLMIDSFGGSVDAGFILIDVIRSIDSPVYAVVTSKAYSMGAIITAYCQKRYILKHGTMMFHEASYGALGEDPTIRSRMEFNQAYLDRIHHELAQIMKMDYAKYRQRIRDAWWVSSEEAVEAHMVDAVVDKITYRKLGTETTEVKRVTTIKTRRVSRPRQGGVTGLDTQRPR